MNASAECPISVPLPDGLTLCEDGLVRPTWASHDRLLRDYYDSEWGVPVHDEAGVFERLALEGWETRIPTGQLNAFLGQLVAAHPHPLRGGKQPRILFGTQASSKPPRFVLFTTGFLDPGYRRFIERRLRETFGFTGTPIQISVRVREKRRR